MTTHSPTNADCRAQPAPDERAIARFLAGHVREFKRIGRATRGEETLESVQLEAWMMIHDLAAKGLALDLDRPEDRKTLFARLYQKLVRYTELHIRHGVRLDHGLAGDEDGAVHPLMYKLAADEHFDPVATLMAREEATEALAPELLNPHRSLAAAYLELLARFRNEMPRVVEHLMISLSYCYRRCAHARRLAASQQGLPAASLRGSTAFVPGPWRRFRIMRTPTQLCLDFDEHGPLFDAAAR